MILLANNSSLAGRFFGDNPQKYTIQLHLTPDGSNAVALSAEDAKVMIGVLSKYEWKEDRSQKEEKWEVHEISWGRYRFYNTHYYMTITSPDGKSVKMRVNGEGFNEDQFLIERANGKPYGTIMFDREKNGWTLKKEDIDKIKQLYFKNFSSLNNVKASNNAPTHIEGSSYSFGNIFFVKIPDIILSQADSNELTRLYNRGWDNSIAFFPGGQPLPEIQLYTSPTIYTSAVDFFISQHEFTPEDQQAIDALIAKYMNGHDGEEKINLKKPYPLEEEGYGIYYQYKDGKLHGQVKVYDENGKLTHEFVYDKGLPATYIRYHANGKKAVEAHLSPQELMVEWTEYDEEGNVTDSDRNAYQTIHNWQQDSENFYKFNRE